MENTMTTPSTNSTKLTKEQRDTIASNKSLIRDEAAKIRQMRELKRKSLHLARQPYTNDFWREKLRSDAHALHEGTLCPSQRVRCAHLAVAFTQGRVYKDIEATTRSKGYEMYQIQKEVAKKAGVSYDDIHAWMSEQQPAKRAA